VLYLQVCCTYGLAESIKMWNRSLQAYIATKDVETRDYTRNQSAIKVKYNKPDIYVYI